MNSPKNKEKTSAFLAKNGSFQDTNPMTIKIGHSVGLV